ncbi:MAG: diguanylate cyclase [Bacillota bacterium]
MLKDYGNKLAIASGYIIVAVIATIFIDFSFYYGEVETVRITFASAVLIISSILIGPFWGAFIGAAQDILVFSIQNDFSYESFLPSITLVSAVWGVIPYYVYKFLIPRVSKELSVFITVAVTQSLLSILTMSFIIHWNFAVPLDYLFINRLPVQAISVPLYTIIVYLFINYLDKDAVLRKRGQELKTLIGNMTDVVAKVDVEGRFTYISESNYRLLGYKPGELLGKNILELIHQDDLSTVGAIFQESIIEGKSNTRVEYRVRKKDGDYIWVETIGSLLLDENGQASGALFTSRDISDRKQVEEQIRYIGFHDQLTNLYNRHYFEQCKEKLKYIPMLSVIMTDVNGLKMINDTYGHEAGDELLKKYANLLIKSFKQSDLIFRWGGDEFIIILKNTEEAKSWELCNRLIKHCGKTFVKDIPLSISVGMSSKLHGEDFDKAIREAEDMMYKNKLNESKSSKNLIMKTLLEALSEKSFETMEHINRMSLLGRQFGERLRLSPSELSRLENLTMLHDIGKINIDSHILLKKTALTDSEREEIKKHPEVGYRITRTAEEFAYIAEEILYHHERWDGKGYPQGQVGQNIPYLARIINLIDSYDVMSNGFPYKKKMSLEEIIEEIENCSGKQFDPDLAKEFVLYLREGCI